MQANFMSSLGFVLEEEGGKSANTNDRGGRTNRGITQMTYDQWRQENGLPLNDVFNITDQEVETIYRQKYWDACKCDEMPAPVDMVMFDTSVQHGPREAAEMLQEALGVRADGIIGPLTIQQMAREYGTSGGRSPKELAADIIIERVNFYRHLIAVDPSQKIFEEGWGRRIAALCEKSGLQTQEV